MSLIEVQIQERGRITIPINIRKKHGLKDGDWITLELKVDDQHGSADSLEKQVEVVELERIEDLDDSFKKIVDGLGV